MVPIKSSKPEKNCLKNEEKPPKKERDFNKNPKIRFSIPENSTVAPVYQSAEFYIFSPIKKIRDACFFQFLLSFQV